MTKAPHDLTESGAFSCFLHSRISEIPSTLRDGCRARDQRMEKDWEPKPKQEYRATLKSHEMWPHAPRRALFSELLPRHPG
jgi:hypothetical protein